MSIIVDYYIGDNGEVLFPLTETNDNTSNLVSERGTFYKVFTHEVVAIEEGNPMGLLLAITYSS